MGPVHRRSVALLIESSNAYARGLLTGIVRHARQLHTPWSIRLVEQGRGAAPPAWLADWHGDGVIARIENQVIADAVLTLNLPVVDVSAARLVPGVPWVETDDAAIAKLAMEHLLERGFRNVAFCGDGRFNWSKWRAKAFLKRAAASGLEQRQCDPAEGGAAEIVRDEIANWIPKLPKPLGIMACYDIRAQQILEVCRDLGVAVPDEVAVIGVDNDELLCNLSSPPLSSVIPDPNRAGYEAALLLEHLMSGESMPETPILVPPRGIATRQSSDVLAIEDSDIAGAVRFIRERACHGISVHDVLRGAPLSRRVFERRFRECLGRTPHQEIVRVKIKRAEELLTETDLGLAMIAQRTGFRHAEYLSVAFKRATGRTPGQYRGETAWSGQKATLLSTSKATF